MIISSGSRRASILDDEPTAAFDRSATRTHAASAVASEPSARAARATVEVLRHGGGLMPRALLGGVFTPGPDSRFVVEVGTTGPSVDGAPTCVSQLAKPLVTGLPEEFVSSVIDGVVRGAPLGGVLVVDRAGFDPVESSPRAFGLAAELLAVVLTAEALGRDVASAARDAMETWPAA